MTTSDTAVNYYEENGVTNMERKSQGLKKPNRLSRVGQCKSDNFQPYSQYAGEIVTPENRHEIKRIYFVDYINRKVQESEELNENMSLEELPEDLKYAAGQFALDKVKVAQKSFKAYMKGKKGFYYRGKFFPVPTIQNMEEMKAQFAAFEEMQANLAAAAEDYINEEE